MGENLAVISSSKELLQNVGVGQVIVVGEALEWVLLVLGMQNPDWGKQVTFEDGSGFVLTQLGDNSAEIWNG